MTQNKFFEICGVKVSSTNLSDACQAIGRWIDEKKKVYVCVAPVSTIVDCQADEDYRKLVNNADMVTPDGMPTVWCGKLKGEKSLARTYGPDLMPALCEFSQAKGYRHYFYGGDENTCRTLQNVLKTRFPGMQIAGGYSPAIRPVHFQEEDSVIEAINNAAPDIIWVGLGSPKQDYWMVEHRTRLNAPVLIGVGAAFDFLAGTKKQAPRWMQRSGLEWLFRLISEPRRLWKRYLVGNTKFLFYLLREPFVNR